MGVLRLERTAALSLVAIALGLALLLAVLPLPAAASVTTLHVTSGSASVLRAGEARPATDGEPLYDGDSVTTEPAATALLAFTDGSTLTLDPSTTVTVAEASAGPASTVTRIVQTVGRTWSSVQRLAVPSSRYEIRTPALTATVRGTAFEVDVAADGTTRVHTVEGAVGVANALGEVLVVAGTQTSATPSVPPAPAATPPPAPLRTIRMGGAPLIVIDPSGRACGRVEGGAVQQQIPGCVVQGDEIRIVGGAASTELRQRELTSPAAVGDVVIVTPRPTPQPTSEIRVPIIGVIPVQPPRGTTVPIGPDAVAPVARLVATTLPPLPSSAPTLQPTVAPAPVPTSVLPTIPALPALTTPAAAPTPAAPTVAPVPTATVEPPPLPTLAPTTGPTILPTTAPSVLPTVSPGALPGAVPTSSPTPSVAPTPTRSPVPATPTPSPTATATPTSTPTIPPVPTAPTLPSAGIGVP